MKGMNGFPVSISETLLNAIFPSLLLYTLFIYINTAIPMNSAKQLSLLVLCTMVVACAVGPDFKRPPPPPVANYTLKPLPSETTTTAIHGGEAQHFEACDLPVHWWKLFASPEITVLVNAGLQNHPNVEAGIAAIRQAKSNLRAQIGSTLFPQVDLAASASRQKSAGGSTTGISSATDPASTGGSTSSPTFNVFTSQLNVSYVFDIFGGNRRAIEALCALVDYQRYQLEGIYLDLSANIVTSAISIADLTARIEATRALIALEQDTLDIVKKQYEVGAIAKLDVLNQEAQVAQLKTTLPPLEVSLRQSQHALIQLIGDFPSNAIIPIITLENLHLPQTLPISIPSQLVRHRPDIRAQEALLHQASAQIGVKTANLFPQFSITATAGSQALQMNQLFNSNTIFWNVTGNLLQPIFHGGALLAERQAAIAAYEQVLAQYKATVLIAFQNVADALSAIELDAVALKAYTDAEIAAKTSYQLTEQQFRLGATTYLNLLTAKRTYDQAVLNRIQAQAKRYSDTVALFQALGGAWWAT